MLTYWASTDSRSMAEAEAGTWAATRRESAARTRNDENAISERERVLLASKKREEKETSEMK